MSRRVAPATGRELAVYRRLQEAGLGHLKWTLQVLAGAALVEDRTGHPAGWVVASREWLHEQTGLTVKTISAHIHALIEAEELYEWEQARPQAGRPREFVVAHLMTARGRGQMHRHENPRNRKPLRSKGTQGKSWGKSTTPINPLDTLPPETAEIVESSETVTQQGHAGEVDGSLLLVPARRSGTKTTHSNRGDNTEREPVTPVPSIGVPPTRWKSWSEVIADASTTILQSQHRTGNRRGEHVGLGRCLDRVTIEQGSEAAGAVFDRAVTRTRRGEGLTTALRDEIKTALDVDDWHSEQDFAATCADTSIPRTIPFITDWPRATTAKIVHEETGT